MLLDFGLSVMSDEQRRTSIRYAGAIEFMAPEQSAGETLFETDVYSFGIILFELLAGTVPFPLKNKGEMARNAVMIAHMENAIPDLLQLRRKAIPGHWVNEEEEMNIPDWLSKMIYKCLEKDPALRFRNGSELHAYIQGGIIAEANRKIMSAVTYGNVTSAVVISAPVDDSIWKEQIQQLENAIVKKDHQISELKYQIEFKDRELYQLNMERYNMPQSRGVNRGTFITVLLIALGLGAYAMYDSFIKPYREKTSKPAIQANNKINSTVDSSLVSQAKTKKKQRVKPKRKAAIIPANEKTGIVAGPADKKETSISKNDKPVSHRYRIKRNAFFYARPDKSTRNNFYIVDRDATLTAIQEADDFIYVEFVDNKGKTTQTWLSKEDLSLVRE